MPQPVRSGQPAELTSLRILVATLIGAIPIMAVAVVVAVPGDEALFAPPPIWAVAAPLVVAVGGALAAHVVGFSVPALPRGLDQAEARRRSMEALRTSTILRFALCEAAAIVGIATTFAAATGSILPFVVGGIGSLLSMAVLVWPSTRNLKRVQARLERDGARSYLRSDAPATAVSDNRHSDGGDGVIREL